MSGRPWLDCHHDAYCHCLLLATLCQCLVCMLDSPLMCAPCLLCSVGTVLFLGFPSLLEPPPRTGPGASRTGLAAVQACMEVVQKRMRQHDGCLLQVMQRGESRQPRQMGCQEDDLPVVSLKPLGVLLLLPLLCLG